MTSLVNRLFAAFWNFDEAACANSPKLKSPGWLRVEAEAQKIIGPLQLAHSVLLSRCESQEREILKLREALDSVRVAREALK